MPNRKAAPPSTPALAPPALKTWHCFAFLILVALLIHWKLHYLLLLIAAFVGFIQLWLWLSYRFPRTMTVTNIIMLASYAATDDGGSSDQMVSAKAVRAATTKAIAVQYVAKGQLRRSGRLHIRSANSGAWHTASIRCPSGSRTKAPK
jgi:hypothetical protein